MKKINFDLIQKKMLDSIKERETHYRIINEVALITKQFEGKEITRRIMTAIKKAYPQYVYYWDASRTFSRSIQIWGAGLTFNERIIIYLPFDMGDEGHIYTHTAFVAQNECHFLEKERNERAIMQAPFLKDAVFRFNILVDEINEIQSLFTEYPLTSIFERGGD